MSKKRATLASRARHHLHQAKHRLGDPILSGIWDPQRMAWARRLPMLPTKLRRHHLSHVWESKGDPVPVDLRTVPGVWRDPAAEEGAFERAPLHDFFQVHAEAAQDLISHGWPYLLPTSPRYLRAIDRLKQARRGNKKVVSGSDSPLARMTPSERSARIREEARRLGLSAVGFAAYDRKYMWAEHAARQETGSVIVCAYEQDHAHTQTAPSARAERAAMFAYAELCSRAAALSDVVQSLGAKAQPHGPVGESIVIHYGVQAGLGQLGLNGQLLTPAAGSRARLVLITTNIDLEHDEPKDFGVNAICDECQVCVRRCPVGAIPVKRAEHRGVMKAKIKTERCFPVVARVEGCAICMKTCPVQKYGLDQVIQHRERTGEILGKGTDDLEGYLWPPDGRFYGSGEKPAITDSTIRPDGWVLDVKRTEPLPSAKA